MNEAEKNIKKGTTTVGLMTKDGIVLCADKRATMGAMIIANKKTDKIHKITDTMAFTIAGSVSDAQLIIKLIKAELRLIKIRNGHEASVKQTANLLGTIVYQNIRRFSPIMAVTGFLLGGTDNSGFHLYEIGPDGSIFEHDDYCTDGCGMVYAFGVLDTLYPKDKEMSLQEGIKLGIKAVNAAMQRDTCTGDGIDVFTITKEGVKKAMTKKLETNIQA